MNAHVRRGNELHFQIDRGDAPDLAEILRSHFGAELILMVANGCRANKNAFELHYLFANNRENWFAHATADLPSGDSTIPSLATFTIRRRALSAKSRICLALKPYRSP